MKFNEMIESMTIVYENEKIKITGDPQDCFIEIKGQKTIWIECVGSQNAGLVIKELKDLNIDYKSNDLS